MPTEELVKGSSIDVKRGIEGRLAFDHVKDIRRDLLGLLPVPLKPFLQDFNFSTELYIELDVVG
jgi:hypothetical protein